MEFYGNITIDQAVLKTLGESKKFDRITLNAAKKGKVDEEKVLEDVIFKSLHKDDLSHVHIQSKAYGPE